MHRAPSPSSGRRRLAASGRPPGARVAGRGTATASSVVLLVASLLWPGAGPVAARPDGGTAAASPFAFLPGDSICLLGNALAERMQHHGWLEARLQCRLPGLGLTVRHLGFSADTLTVQQRTAGFGSWEDHLRRCWATVILAAFGYVESFGGPAGLDDFAAGLAGFVRRFDGVDFGGARPARLVLLSPIACEDVDDPHLPDPAAGNARITPYVEVMRTVATEHGVPFVDLFDAMHARYAAAGEPLTIDGVHLTEAGNAVLAEEIERGLLAAGVPVPDPARLERVRQAVLEKNLVWFNRYRATDGYNVYGGRSSLAYAGGVTNFEVLQREMEILDAAAARLDERIHALAQGRVPALGSGDLPEPLAVETNRPGPGPDGSWPYRDGEEAIEAMTPGAGLSVRLFADEDEFPELANPVQMAFDPAGRLWVASWPTYPHWAPGEPMDDKLVVVHDDDGDGRADRTTVFADDLHNPTGFEHWNGGVLVAQVPDLVFLADTDGDGRADHRERVLHGLSSADTHHSANSFVLGPGGALYFQEGVFHQSQVESVWGPVRNRDACVWRFEPRSFRVERYVAYGFANPHGHVFDRWGQDFVTDGTGNVNYYALPFSGHLEPPDKHAGYFPFFQQRSRPAAATEIVSSRHLPEAMQGDYLVANVIGFQGIFRYRLHDDGSGFGATEAEPLVSSSDPNFRPVDIEIGPDGAVWFLDWQAALIGHMQHHLRDPNRDHGHGRVYRVVADGRRPSSPPRLDTAETVALVAQLGHPEDRVRYRARVALSSRPTDEVVAAARDWAAGRLAAARRDGAGRGQAAPGPFAPDPEHDLLEALWLQQQHGVLDRELLDQVLASPEPRARAAAVRVARQMRHDLPDVLDILAAAVEDEHPRVRLEAVVAASFVPSARAAEIALRSRARPTDRFLDYALGETLSTLEPHWRSALVAGEPFAAGAPGGLAHVLARLDTDALLTVRAGPARDREILARHGLSPDVYRQALDGLARAEDIPRPALLLDAIERADARARDHADHLLAGLFATLAGLPPGEVASLSADLARLAAAGRRPATRQLATVARLRADGEIEPAWREALAASSPVDALSDLLDAAARLGTHQGERDTALAAALHPRVLSLLDRPPPELAGHGASSPGVRGRFVRIELPGEARTLTLAEVEVRSGGRNVAREGIASQSSTSWGGLASRAIDGNASGRWGDGGQSHTTEDLPDPWWQVDLDAEHDLDAITIWNRTDGTLGRRLDAFVVRVLDAGRRTVFEHAGGRAPEESVTIELAPPDERLRRAAVRCLAALGVDPAGTALELAQRFGDDVLRPAIVPALRTIPPGAWPHEATAMVGAGLLELFDDEPADVFTTNAGRELLALADEVAPRLPDGEARRLLAVRRRLGPHVVVIRPVPDALLYDRRAFTVVAGRPVEIVFDNVDIMPHNLLVASPGALATVGLAAEAMASEPDAWDRGYVPDVPEVLAATALLPPGTSQTLAFDAPEMPGEYPYVCTFPGHWVRMNGVMNVVAGWDEVPETRVDGAATAAARNDDGAGGGSALARSSRAAPPRAFVRHWTLDDFAGELAAWTGTAGDGLAAPGPADRAHAPGARDGEGTPRSLPPDGLGLLEAASCLRCHRLGGEGGLTGPPFEEVAARHGRAGLLRQILAPSETILEGYGAELLVLTDGRVVSGRVLAEDEATVRVQHDPYAEEALTVRKADIAERRPSALSPMPEGLLSTFTREEILAMLEVLAASRAE